MGEVFDKKMTHLSWSPELESNLYLMCKNDVLNQFDLFGLDSIFIPHPPYGGRGVPYWTKLQRCRAGCDADAKKAAADCDHEANCTGRPIGGAFIYDMICNAAVAGNWDMCNTLCLFAAKF